MSPTSKRRLRYARIVCLLCCHTRRLLQIVSESLSAGIRFSVVVGQRPCMIFGTPGFSGWRIAKRPVLHTAMLAALQVGTDNVLASWIHFLDRLCYRQSESFSRSFFGRRFAVMSDTSAGLGYLITDCLVEHACQGNLPLLFFCQRDASWCPATQQAHHVAIFTEEKSRLTDVFHSGLPI